MLLEESGILPDAQATIHWGRQLAAQLKAGDVIALVGDLGAGKTHVSKGIISGLGCREEVTSPTFSLLQEYRDAEPAVYHLDFYRMDTAQEVLALGWDELLDEPAVIIVEWADRFRELMPCYTQWWHISPTPCGGRSIALMGA
jgi:tRNA threonylcarbamoyladenosine biosynthesis protein TsaE